MANTTLEDVAQRLDRLGKRMMVASLRISSLMLLDT